VSRDHVAKALCGRCLHKRELRPSAAVRTKTGGTKGAKPARAAKERVTFQLPVGLIEKARDVVFFSPGLTMASFMEEALVAQLKRAAKKRGEPFPSRAGAALKTGRPIKTTVSPPLSDVVPKNKSVRWLLPLTAIVPELSIVP
jgi:hypothetical protein